MKKARTYKDKVTEDSVIEKYMNGAPMTLKEASLALFMYDRAHPEPGKKPPTKPMSEMGFLKLEKRILNKLKAEFEKAGISQEEVRELLFGNKRTTVETKYAHPSIDHNN